MSQETLAICPEKPRGPEKLTKIEVSKCPGFPIATNSIIYHDTYIHTYIHIRTY